MRVLLVERDPDELKHVLELDGFLVDTASDSKEADRLASTLAYHAIVLDIDIASPDGENLSLLKKWRHYGVSAQTLILTSLDSLQDEITALSMGADDFVAKPVRGEDLIERLRALEQRAAISNPMLETYDLEIDSVQREVKRGGRNIPLTRREFDLLHYLAVNRGKAVSRSMIRRHLYNENEATTSNVVDVYIRYLRKKVDDGFDFPLILTSWGKGYLLRGDPVA